MSTIITRTGKGSALEWEEVDANFTNLNTDKVEKTAADITGGTINGTSIGATTPSTVTATTLVVNDNTTLGSSNTDTINFVGRVNSNFEPATDNTYDLGRVGHEWRDLYLDGTANIDNLVADTAAITGGTIDNTVIGGTTPAAGTFTTLTATGQTSLGGVTDSESMRVLPPASTGTYIQVQSASSTVAEFRAIGSQATNSLRYVTRGSGNHIFSTGNSGSTVQLQVAHTASAVNFVQVTGAATGSGSTTGVIVSAQGSDTTTNLALQGKGSAGGVTLGTGFGVSFKAVGFAGSTIVNNLQAQGSATTISPVLSAQGSDTNISQVFQSKGTGAINLAPGSSGVNISNGGTVTAITRTAASSGYTSLPSVAISAPTTAGGVQATAVVGSMVNTGAAVASGGTGYTVGNTLTVLGGTPTGVSATLTVTAVSGGVVTSATPANFGQFSVLPTNPVSVTGGTGSGATFNLNYGVGSNPSFTITNAGSGYVEQPTVTFSGGGGSGAAAYATVGSFTTIKSIGSGTGVVTNQAFTFQTPNSITSGNPAFVIRDAASFDSWYQMGPSSSQTFLIAKGNANASAYLGASGSGSVRLTTNGDSLTEQFRVAHTASAVNYVQVTGAATGGTPSVTAQGSDANVGLSFSTKGSFNTSFRSGGGSWIQFVVNGANNSVNYLSAAGSVANQAPILSSVGTDTNIDLVLTPKGTGTVVANGPFTATGQTSLGGVAGSESLRVNALSGSTRWIEIEGSVSGNTSIRTRGAGNPAFQFVNRGTGQITFSTADTLSNEQFRVAHTASAVNFVQVTGAATGGIPIISAQGSDTNVNLRFQSKGASGFLFTTGAGTQFIVQNSAGSSVNQLQAQGSAAGAACVLSTQGSDTNIDLALTPKGTGNVRFGTFTADMTLVVQGYVEVKDSGGTIRKLAVIA